MKIKIYILYISLFLFSACTVQNILEGQEKRIVPVKSIPDKDIISIIEPYKIGIDSVMNEILCFSSVEMSKGKPVSLLGNFVTDLCLNMYDTIADICIMNNGGLRSSLPYGKITRGDIYKLMPFENELVVIELSIPEIFELSKYIISRGGEPFSGFNIYSKDSIYIHEHDGDILHRNDDSITIWMPVLDWRGNYIPLTKDYLGKDYDDYYNHRGTLKVLTSDYLANGGDKMSFFNNKYQYKVGIKLRDAIINYCVSKDTITSRLDDRIKIIE